MPRPALEAPHHANQATNALLQQEELTRPRDEFRRIRYVGHERLLKSIFAVMQKKKSRLA